MKRAMILSSSRKTWIFALVLSLLFTQFLGQHHRLRHAKWDGNTLVQQIYKTSSNGLDETNHSCIVYDAATLADTVSACVAIPLDFTGKYLLAQAILATSWVAPFTHFFLSRAPPHFF